MKIIQDSSFLKIEIDGRQFFLEIKKEEDHLLTKINNVRNNTYEYIGDLVIYPGANLNLDIPEGNNIYERCLVYARARESRGINRILTYNAPFKTSCDLFTLEGDYFIAFKPEKEKEYILLMLQTSLIFAGVR